MADAELRAEIESAPPSETQKKAAVVEQPDAGFAERVASPQLLGQALPGLLQGLRAGLEPRH